MLSVDPSPGRFLRISAEGVLKAEDYAAFEQRFREVLQHLKPPAPLLLDLRGFEGWMAPGFVRDLRFDFRHRNTFSRIAVLGARPWHRWITCAGDAVLLRRDGRDG
jgi:hypothetical protein